MYHCFRCGYSTEQEQLDDDVFHPCPECSEQSLAHIVLLGDILNDLYVKEMWAPEVGVIEEEEEDWEDDEDKLQYVEDMVEFYED